jgi:hypothetical protein
VDDGLVRIVDLFSLLANLGHEEDLVVHGKGEVDREHHQRHEGDNRDGAFEADQARGPGMVEGVGDDAEGGEDGKHVHHYSLEWDQQRAEGKQEQQEREHEHDTCHQGQLARDLARQVDVACGRPTDVGAHQLALGRLENDVVSQGIYEVLGRTRGGRGGRCHRVDGGVALVVDQRKAYRVHTPGLLKIRAQAGEPRVRGLGLKELLLVLLPGTLLLLLGLLLYLLLYELVLLGLLLFGLLLYGIVLLGYLLLCLLLDSLVLLCYLLLGQLIDGLLSPWPYLLLGLISLFPDLLFFLLLLLFGLRLDLLFCLLLRFLGLLLDRLLCLGLLCGDLLLRGLLLVVTELVEIGLVVMGRLAEAHGYEHRTVRAWAEPFGHRVVGLA